MWLPLLHFLWRWRRFMLDMTALVCVICVVSEFTKLPFHTREIGSVDFFFSNFVATTTEKKSHPSQSNWKCSKQTLSASRPPKPKYQEFTDTVGSHRFFFETVTLSESFPFVSNVAHKAADTEESPRGGMTLVLVWTTTAAKRGLIGVETVANTQTREEQVSSFYMTETGMCC